METIPVHRPWSKADWLTFKAELEQKEIYIPNKITPHRLEKILDQYYNLIEKALDKACPKQKEIIVNRNNPWHKGTLKQLRIEKFARYEEYIKDRTNTENKLNALKSNISNAFSDFEIFPLTWEERITPPDRDEKVD